MKLSKNTNPANFSPEHKLVNNKAVVQIAQLGGGMKRQED